MVKRRATRDASSDESCNEMREHRGKERRNEISKLWSRPRAMKESIEVSHQKLDLENQDEQGLLTVI
ncbi:hypothetical protein F2Q70_00021819 [Brassica cretica]|uniref:Uncharacterized protein n=1 Tax=Brassica cretica TaxID=69181 RepID=A0A8S9GQM6_BRACR|nr:hypothetical protein F2Q70_00021819 [Brassica cretica]